MAGTEAALVAALHDAAPDILFLQESWVDDADASVEQASVLGDLLGLPHQCRSGVDLVHGDWSPVNAIVARWPLRDVRVHDLPSIDDGWGGVVVRAVVDGPRGELDTYCVALDWPPQASRRRQHAVAQLARLIHDDQAAAKRPVLVAGDFNADPHSDEIRALTGRREPPVEGVVLFDAWEAGGDSSGATWSRSNPWAAPTLLPDRRIDYIFTGWPRRGGVGSVVSAELVGTDPDDGTIPSDHYGVLAIVRY